MTTTVKVRVNGPGYTAHVQKASTPDVKVPVTQESGEQSFGVGHGDSIIITETHTPIEA